MAEIEESVLPLSIIFSSLNNASPGRSRQTYKPHSNRNAGDFVIFDVGSGKGFLSLLLSFLMPHMLSPEKKVNVKKIVMIDRNFSFTENDTRVGMQTCATFLMLRKCD